MKLNDFPDFVRVVIVDDNKDEGLHIKPALERKQIPSVFYFIQSNSDLPTKPHENVRLVFFDLVFKDAGPSPEQRATNALRKLSKIIGKRSFYILVLWSSHTTEPVANFFKEYLERQDTFSKPYKLLLLQKSAVQKAGKYNANKIISKINNGLKDIPALRVFLEWEQLATNSISDVSKEIASQKKQADLSKTVNSLAEAYAGKGGIKEIPRNALLAFNEVFKDSISKGIVSHSFGNLYQKIDKGELGSKEKARLNTSLIFTPDTTIGPGAVFRIHQKGKEKENFISEILNHTKEGIGEDIYNKIIPIAVEVTPLCNFAQRNSKHSYFLNGILHPTFYRKTKGKKKDIRIKEGYCYKLEKNYLDEKTSMVFSISFNLKLFHSGCLSNYVFMDKKLRENLVIDLQHKISAYISRPVHVLL